MFATRPRQPLGTWPADNPLGGYYNDLSSVLTPLGGSEAALRWLQDVIKDPASRNPVSVIQLALATWQTGHLGSDQEAIIHLVTEWITKELQTSAPLAYHWPMPHTYHLQEPWQSSMAIGQAISLCARVLTGAHRIATTSKLGALLLEADPAQEGSLAATTPDGIVYQEYPSVPPAHVLNGWVFTLWGLHDLGLLGHADALAAWEAGCETLVQRLSLYRVGGGWSRYDLFPHPIKHWASPFYHDLHIAQLQATHALCGHDRLLPIVNDMVGARTSWKVTRAVVHKGAFRLLRPRRRRM